MIKTSLPLIKTIKIPVQAHGLLTETTNEKPRPPPLNLSSTSGDPGLDNDDDDDADDDKSDYEDNMPNGDCIRTVSIRTAIDSPNSFLKHMDNDLKLICKSAPIRKHNFDEVARTLTVNCINPLTSRKQQEKTLNWECLWYWMEGNHCDCFCYSYTTAWSGSILVLVFKERNE